MGLGGAGVEAAGGLCVVKNLPFFLLLRKRGLGKLLFEGKLVTFFWTPSIKSSPLQMM